MDNLKSPAYPHRSNSLEGGHTDPGFTKLEKAALMIAQGHVTNFTMGNQNPDPLFLQAFGAKCVSLAKAVIEEANK